MTDTKKGNKRTLLPAIAIASALAIIGGAFASVAAHDGFPNYADVNNATKSQTNGVVTTTITADSQIPRGPDSYIKSVLVYGYGWFDKETGKAFTPLIHPNFRDSTKNPDRWHGHPITLTTGTANSDYCIAYFGDARTTAEGGISIVDATDTMMTSTSLSKLNGLKTADIDNAVSFIMQEDSDCPGIEKYINGEYTIAHLGVVVHDTETVQAANSQ